MLPPKDEAENERVLLRPPHVCTHVCIYSDLQKDEYNKGEGWQFQGSLKKESSDGHVLGFDGLP